MVKLDCSGHLCPVPILMTEEKFQELKPGQALEVEFTDPGAGPDLRAWCQATGNELLEIKQVKSRYFASLRKRQ